VVIADGVVLDELLRDRRPALDGAPVRDVGPESPGDAANVDAAVLVEPLVLDGDDRLLHDRVDLVARDEAASLVSAEHGEDAFPARVVDEAVLLQLRLVGGIKGGDLPRDRANEPERERCEPKQEQHSHQGEESKFADLASATRVPV
jgi:hypothetical protein